MELALAIIGSGALSALISGFFNLITSGKKKKGGVTAGTRILLYDRIKYLGRSYLRAGHIASEDLEDIIEMHKVYHTELGGNGYLDSIMEKVRRLPIQDQ
jgi:hypothetical protein